MLETRLPRWDQGGTDEARWKMGREQEMLCSSCLPLLALTGHQGRGAWAGDPAGTSPTPTERRLMGPKRKQPKPRGISDIFQSHQLIQAHPPQPEPSPGRAAPLHPQEAALEAPACAHPHGTTLPETLGVGVQEKPPLDWSVSPKSYVSLGLGLYSRLGCEEASLILEEGK